MELQPDDADFLWGLFEQHVDRGLAFVRGRCAQAVPTPELSQVACLSRLLQVGQSWTMTLVALLTMQPAGCVEHPRGAGAQDVCTLLLYSHKACSEGAALCCQAPAAWLGPS